MKLFLGLVLLAVCSYVSAQTNQCDSNLKLDTVFSKIDKTCNDKVIEQIKREATASSKYLQMGAYFARDQVNLPGFAELFFKAAKEEREHSAVLMNYLSTRLAKDTDLDAISKRLISNHIINLDTFSGLEALTTAYEMEREITQNIKDVIAKCDDVKDYHISDFLTGDFLTEQYESERNFAGKLATLKKMTAHGPLADFLFDKTL